MWQTAMMPSFFPQYRHDDHVVWKGGIWKNQYTERELEQKWIPVRVSRARKFLKNNFDLCKSKVFVQVCITNCERKKQYEVFLRFLSRIMVPYVIQSFSESSIFYFYPNVKLLFYIFK